MRTPETAHEVQRKAARRRREPNAPVKNDAKCAHGIEAGDFCTQCEKTCSICQLPYTGWGNNAWPVNEGRCCKNCNDAVVIVARLNQIHTAKAK